MANKGELCCVFAFWVLDRADDKLDCRTVTNKIKLCYSSLYFIALQLRSLVAHASGYSPHLFPSLWSRTVRGRRRTRLMVGLSPSLPLMVFCRFFGVVFQGVSAGGWCSPGDASSGLLDASYYSYVPFNSLDNI